MRSRWFVFVVSLLTLGCGPAPPGDDAGDAGGPGPDGGTSGLLDAGVPDGGGALTLEEKLDGLSATVEDEMAELAVPGAAVAVILEGEVVYARGFGVRAMFSNDPVDADTTFNIASMSKAMAVSTFLSVLEEHPDVTLDTPVLDLVPDFSFPPEEADAEITLAMLLSHQSGLPTHWHLGASAADIPDDATSLLLTEVLPSLSDHGMSLFSRPGHGFVYSNPGIGLASIAFENVADHYFADLLQERVAGPLGMSRTSARGAEVEAAGNHTFGLDHLATGFTTISPTSVDAAWGRPAGGVWSSVQDVARFVQFQLDGDPAVLSEEHRHLMGSAFADTRGCGSLAHYGLGLFHDDGYLFGLLAVAEGEPAYFGLPAIFHTGGVDGFRSLMLWLPDLRAGYVILQNASPERLWRTAAYIHSVLLPLPEPVPAPDDSGDPAEWAAFAGTYRDAWDPGVGTGDLVLSVEGDTVTLDLPDSPWPYEPTLVPVCRDTFLVEIGPWTLNLTLYPNAEGAPDLILIEGLSFYERITEPMGKASVALAPAGERAKRLEQRLKSATQEQLLRPPGRRLRPGQP